MIKISQLDNLDNKYPLAGSIVSGLSVLPEIPNINSIAASLIDYRELKGIRAVPISDLIGDPKSYFYAADDFKRCRELAEEIKQTKQIKPIIVVIDKKEVYCLEGSHRVCSLKMLGLKMIPALVIVDEEGL